MHDANYLTTFRLRVRRISKFAVLVQFFNVTIKITLFFMKPACYAAVYSWGRLTLVFLIGSWAIPWLIKFRFLPFDFFVSFLGRLRPATTLLYPPDDEYRPLRTPRKIANMESGARSTAKTRRATIEPLDVESILTSGGPNSPMRPAPAEHISSPRSAATTQDDSPRPSSSHSRTGSLADVARQGKRFSMNFPIQGPNASSSRPSSWYNSPAQSPVIAGSPTEPPTFLSRLAAQERRVLELKEELKRAELELEKLKKQFAKEEATKKRSEVRSVQKLQPLTTQIPSLEPLEDDQDGSSEWLQKEMERRKDILGGVKSSNRKVFSGSRHLRTLSLLSPERGHFTQPFPQPSPNPSRRSEDTPTQSRKPNRSSTTPDMAAIMDGAQDDKWETESENDAGRDAFMKTGRQMAADIKEGLLTFFEDIRQATVGQEGITGTSSRITQNTTNGRLGSTKPGPRGQGRSRDSTTSRMSGSSTQMRPPFTTLASDPLLDISASFWRENGVSPDTPVAKPVAKISKKNPSHRHSPYITPTHRPKDIDDAWDTWGTPIRQPPSQSSGSVSSASPALSDSQTQSTPNTLANTISPTPATASTDRTLTPGSLSNSGDGKTNRDSIPWPAIQKLSPSNLRRTASHLMNEWEKSLTPTPPARDQEPESYLAYPSSGEGTPARVKGD